MKYPSIVQEMCSKYAKNGLKIVLKTLLKTVIFPQNSSTIMSTTKQQFFGEIKMRFYLRSPYSTRPCMIFLGTNIGGKFYRASAQVKVYPSHWDSKRQLAVISNVQSIQDNRNNKIVNDQLSKLRRYFSEFIEYICNNDVDDIGETLKLFIYRDMAKKRKLDLKQVIAEALEYYHKYVKPSIKDSTKRQNESLLSEFGRFVDSLPEKDKTMQIFSQKGLNRYKQYLIDKMERSKTDDKMRNFGVGMLNRCGAIIALLINRVLVEKEDDINPVVWNKVDDPRREDQIGHIPLLDNEVAAIENCSGLTDVEEEYRNLFLLQLECGQRVSDMAKILTGKYNIQQGKKYKYIVLSTIKENIKAYVPLTPRMTMLLENVKAHKLVKPNEFEEKTKGKGNNTYNEAIRRIAKKADLDREIVKINASQTEVRKPLYETITSHDARCTFITNMIKKGVSPDRLCKMTGHASDEMIKRVYAQLSDADEINRIESDLYSDVDDEDADFAAYIASNNPNEPEAKAHNETPNESDVHSPMNKGVTNVDYSQQFSLESYLNGLNDVVDASINESELLYNQQEQLISELHTFYKPIYDNIKTQVEEGLCSKEDIINGWNDCSDFCERMDSSMPENKRGFIDGYKFLFLQAWMDICKEKQLGDDLILTLDRLYQEVNEENPTVCWTYRMLNLKKGVLQAYIVLNGSLKAFYYIVSNRPKVANSLIDVNSCRFTLDKIPNWALVHRELKNIPAIELEAIIQRSNCDYDIRTKLYQSIVTDDLEMFTKCIKPLDQEFCGLIEFAYMMNFANRFFAEFNKSFNNDSNPIDAFSNLDVFSLLNNPFSNLDVSISTIMDNSSSEEYIFSQLNRCLEMLDFFRNQALSPEKKVLNKLLKLVDNYPELKEAYNEYNAKQNVSSDTEQPKEQVKAPEDKKEENPEEPKEQKTVPNYLPSRTNNINIDELIRLLTQKDKLNNNHIFVTLVKCDLSETDVAMCLKYFLDYKSSTLSFKLRWNDRNKVSLKFLIRLLFNTNGKATIKNVIEKDAKKAYDGISDKVSTGQGGFPIWPPVIEVFENCPKSIENAEAGDNGTEARKYNLKQLQTIAKIYFACRK